MRLFQSHAGIEHLNVNWNGHPLLLFADMEAKDYARVGQYQFAKAVTTLRQNVTMGLKKGNTVLIHFQYQGNLYHAILMMSEIFSTPAAVLDSGERSGGVSVLLPPGWKAEKVHELVPSHVFTLCQSTCTPLPKSVTWKNSCRNGRGLKRTPQELSLWATLIV